MHLQLDERPYGRVGSGVTPEGRHAPVSFWHETVEIVPGAPLSGGVTCDVAIVGGGFTALSAAYHLKRLAPSLDVLVLERAVVGHGASGRNGGFAMPLIGWDLYYAARALGEETARDAYRMMYDAVAHLRSIVAEHHIDCDLEATGYLLINTCAARERRARKELEVAHRLGFDHAWLEGAALEEHIRCASFRSAVFDPHPCIINPAKLARGMKAVVERMGVRVAEQSPLVELIDGKPVTLKTPGAAVRATQVLLAVNGYGASLGFMADRVLPVHTYIVLTEPLTDAQLREIGWAEKRASLETARNFIHYFRLTADNRILFGGEDAELYYAGRYQDADERIFRALEARFREYFPSLASVRITHRWGGVLGVGLDMFPTFGAGGQHKNIFHAGAYAGHGVSLSNYAGVIMAPQMLRAAGHAADAEGPLPFFYGRKPGWLPPDPVRFVGMRAYRHLLRAQDAWEGA